MQSQYTLPFEKESAIPQHLGERQNQAKIGIVRDWFDPLKRLQKSGPFLPILGRIAGEFPVRACPEDCEENGSPTNVGEDESAWARREAWNSGHTNGEAQPKKSQIEITAEGDVAVIQRLLYAEAEPPQGSDCNRAAGKETEKQPRIESSPISLTPAGPEGIGKGDGEKEAGADSKQERPRKIRSEVVSGPKN